ncbi:GNAT family N-acetyltransferase [Streptococcus agalactiae]|uniref:GNAT family N-acetyltransferase n=1 Tax=Streptococcus agalactiae TaxID=1311 RepID=UPI003C775D2A
MACIIRRARLGDEVNLAYIQTESWKAAFGKILPEDIIQKTTEIEPGITMYQQLLHKEIGKGYILEVDSNPHCMAWWDKSREDDMLDYAELICIHSLKEGWGKGYGSQMMNHVLSEIQQAGYNKVMLWVFTENTRARKFYDRFGFSFKGKSKTYFEKEEMCYEKILHQRDKASDNTIV